MQRDRRVSRMAPPAIDRYSRRSVGSPVCSNSVASSRSRCARQAAIGPPRSGWIRRACSLKRLGWMGQSEPVDLQQNLQRRCASALRLSFGCASASTLSPYLTSIKRLFTNTYKRRLRTVDPKVEGSSPFGLVEEVLLQQALTNTNRTDSVPSEQKLASGLFSQREIDADLRTVIDRWPEIPPELRAAIVKMISK